MKLTSTVEFEKNCNFYRELKSEVNGAFSEGRKKANSFMYVKGVLAIACVFVPYSLILTGKFSGLVMLLLASVMGIGLAFTGFSVYHDALHHSFSRRPFINRLLGSAMDIAGLNSYHWTIRHNQIHHSYTNVHHADEDINGGGLLVLTPFDHTKWYHKYQHIYFMLLYSTIYILWVFVSDFIFFSRSELGPFRGIRIPAKEVFKLFFFKLLFIFYTIFIPLKFLHISIAEFITGYSIMLFTAGMLYGLVFNLAHVVEGVCYGQAAASLNRSWAIHQVLATSNFAMENKLLTWFLGGLNYQIEHHLFPNIASVHYPEISKIVRAHAEKYGIPYNAKKNLSTAFISHIRMLRHLGSRVPND